MLIYLGADHRGFQLKESIKNFLKNQGYEVLDKGNDHYDENDDYPDFAAKVAQEVGLDPVNRRGILICGSGIGMDIVANRFKGVHSALVYNPDQAYLSRNDGNTNVLTLGADFVDKDNAFKIVSIWLQTPFSGEDKHQRRLDKIRQIEMGL